MKKRGDIQKQAAKSLGEVARSFANDIAVPGDRFGRFWNYEPIPIYTNPHYSFYATDKRVKAVIGANRTHKTYNMVWESVMVFCGMVPPAIQDIYPHTLPDYRPRHVRIIVQNYTKHWPEVIRPILLGEEYGILPEAWSDWNESEKMFTGPDGSWLSILAVDPHERDSLKVANTVRGAQIDHTGIDEINHQLVYTESLVRMAQVKDGPRTITMSFCPQEGFECWTFDELYKRGYNPVTKQRLPADELDPTIFVQKVSMRDNPHIDDQTKREIIGALKPWEVAFRVDGEYSERAANPFFNMELLIRWEESGIAKDGVRVLVIEREVDTERGVFKGDIEVLHRPFDERIEAVWEVWEAPKHGEKYVLSIDAGEGNERSDPTAMSVWKCTNRLRPVQVAQLRTRAIRPGDAGVQAACMANFYGDCLVVPERNTTAGGMLVDRIRNYCNLYTKILTDTRRKKQTKKLGWHTQTGTKGPMLDNMYKYFSEWSTLLTKDGKPWSGVRSVITLNELQGYEERVLHDKEGHFQKIEWGARAGAHDDTVMEMAIGLQVIRGEYHKIKTCRLEKKKVASPLLSDLEKEAAKGNSRAFTSYKKKKSLRELSHKAHPERRHAHRRNTKLPASKL